MPALRKNLQSICTDGIAFSLMVGFGETYIPAFAMALGMGEVLTGLIATLPILGGSIIQLASPWGVGRFRSYRQWILLAVGIQVCSLLALAAIARVGSAPAWLVFFMASLYWAGGLATGAAWNTWVEFLVPSRIRPTFFAKRVRMCQTGLLFGLVLGGICLRYAQVHNFSLSAFSGLFLLAGVCRAISWVALASQSESAHWLGGKLSHTVARKLTWQTSRQQPTSDIDLRRFVMYLCLMQVGVYISGPYFTPYMLKHLELSYMSYMMLLAFAFAGKVFALPFVGQAARRWGAGRVFWWGSLGIVPVAALWTISSSMYFLAGVQVISGICWATYELSMFLLFFERIPCERRLMVLSYYNVGNSLAMVAGALLGAVIMRSTGGGVAGYFAVFVASAIGRALAIRWMPTYQPSIHTDSTVRPVLASKQTVDGHALIDADSVPAAMVDSLSPSRRREETPVGSGSMAKTITA